jgi:hypothetical protein
MLFSKQRNLNPVFTADNRNDFFSGFSDKSIKEIKSLEQSLLEKNSTNFTIIGFCSCCQKKVSFIVDYQWAVEITNGKLQPNWRERIECPECHLNNRQRLMVTLIRQFSKKKPIFSIYFMEQVTPIFA